MRTTTVIALVLSASAVPAMSMPLGVGSQYTARNNMYDLLARSATDGSEAVDWHGVIDHVDGLYHAIKDDGKGKREFFDLVARSAPEDSEAIDWHGVIDNVDGLYHAFEDDGKGKRELYDLVARSSPQDGSGALNWLNVFKVAKGTVDLLGDHKKSKEKKKDKKKDKREEELLELVARGMVNDNFVGHSYLHDPMFRNHFAYAHVARGDTQRRPGHFGGAALRHPVNSEFWHY
ncbi:hypothetical protein WOLCODRAFT_140113, partial [Wolfiporia cocos MD-104 SS10]